MRTKTRWMTAAGLALGLSSMAHAVEVDSWSLPLSARTTLGIGNSNRVVHPDGTAAPIAAGGMVLLDERCYVGTIHAGNHVRSKLLAEVDGDVVVTRGTLQFGNQTYVHGNVTAAGAAVVGVSSIVDGDVTSITGDVTIARLSTVGGNVFAGDGYNGERDIVVGSPGTTVQVVGDSIVRDRSEYFGDIVHEGQIAFPGVGEPTLHGTVTQVPAGSLTVPALPLWSLAHVTIDDVPPGFDTVRARTADGVVEVPPGEHRGLNIDRGATARLVSGDYTFDQILTNSDAHLEIDLSAPPHTLRVRVRNDVSFGRRFTMDVGSNDPAVKEAAAAAILFESTGGIRVSPDAVLYGTFRSDDTMGFGHRTMHMGGAASASTLKVGRDSTLIWVPSVFAPTGD